MAIHSICAAFNGPPRCARGDDVFRHGDTVCVYDRSISIVFARSEATWQTTRSAPLSMNRHACFGSPLARSYCQIIGRFLKSPRSVDTKPSNQ